MPLTDHFQTAFAKHFGTGGFIGKLNNKVAVVTGATSGIGTGIVSVFAEEGAKVVFCGRREEKGLAFEAELKQAGYDVTFVKADVTRKEDLQALLDTTLEKYGQVDILVNNAGIMRYYSILEMDIEKDYDQVMNVNLRAYFLSTSLFAKAMKAGGSIINISSVGGKSGSNTCTSYGASKAGVINLTAGAAKELAPLGIRVNAILPGMVYSEIGDFLLANKSVFSALKYRGYNARLVVAKCGHSLQYLRHILPDALRYIWGDEDRLPVYCEVETIGKL